MNKTQIKLFVTNYKSKINSLLNRVRSKEITHIIVTNQGKIKCYESVELFSGETKITVAKCLIKMKQYIITIDSDNIDYILEKYDDGIWNQICNISNVVDEENNDYDIYR